MRETCPEQLIRQAAGGHEHGVVSPSPALAVAAVLLTALAVAAVALARLPLRGDVVVSALRATVQLAAVSAALVVVLGSSTWTGAYLALMFAVATVTAARRVGVALRRPWTGVPIAAGTLPVLALVTASGTLPWRPASVLPVAGILLGGAMTATVLAARRMTEDLSSRAGEYDAALSLGLSPRDAALEVARPAAALALVPGLDQTRTVGLVTLPGAFVGVLLGGGSAAQAGAAQLLVLVGLLAAQSVAVLATVELLARRHLLPAGLAARLPT